MHSKLTTGAGAIVIGIPLFIFALLGYFLYFVAPEKSRELEIAEERTKILEKEWCAQQKYVTLQEYLNCKDL